MCQKAIWNVSKKAKTICLVSNKTKNDALSAAMNLHLDWHQIEQNRKLGIKKNNQKAEGHRCRTETRQDVEQW